MKGVNPTAEELVIHDRLASLGCVACRQLGFHNPVVSIHHVNGRTKPGCHRDVLPLCGPHHQKQDKNILAVHGNKRAWEAKFGNQIDLVEQLMAEIGVPYTRPEQREKPVRAQRKRRAAAPKIEQKSPLKMPKPARPAVKRKMPAKPKPTAEQKQAEAMRRKQQRQVQKARKEAYELEHKDRLDALKEQQRAAAKEYRQAQKIKAKQAKRAA